MNVNIVLKVGSLQMESGKDDHTGLSWALTLMSSSYRKIHRETHTEGERPVWMQTEIGVMHLQAKEHQEMPGTLGWSSP